MTWKSAWAGLRQLVWEWDPIGVADFAPNDEYDCMLGPLLTRLNAGAEEPEIRDFLRHELEDHFGLSVAQDEVEAEASRIISWWTTREI